MLLPLGVKLEPNYESDDSVLDQDSESVALVNSNTQLHKNKRFSKESSKDMSHREITEDKPKPRSKKPVAFESQPDILSDTGVESDIIVTPDSKLKESDNVSEDVSPSRHEHSSDVVIP